MGIFAAWQLLSVNNMRVACLDVDRLQFAICAQIETHSRFYLRGFLVASLQTMLDIEFSIRL